MVAEKSVPEKEYGYVMRVLQSMIQSRKTWLSQFATFFGDKRNYYDVLGYKLTLGPEDYRFLYDRGDIASRVVRAFPETTWRHTPEVVEEETENKSPWDTAFEELSNRLDLFHKFKRVDILACLGRYAVMFLGFNDATSIEMLSQPVNRSSGNLDLMYLSLYSDMHVRIHLVDKNPASPRFGKPEIYEIDFDRDSSNERTRQAYQGWRFVHWSRIIHIADGLLEDEVYGVPKLQPIHDRFHDMLKVVGGSSEQFWRVVRRNLILEIDREAQIRDGDLEALKEKAEAYVNEKQTALAVQGGNVKMLDPEVSSPAEHFDVIIKLIAGTWGIPMRLLVGSERGELASSQDEVNWVDQNTVRQTEYAGPVIIRQFVDRLVLYGVLPTPSKGIGAYEVIWPPLMTEDPNEQADRHLKRAQTLDTVARGMTLEVFPREEVREEIGLDPVSSFGEPEVDDIPDNEIDDDDEDIPEDEPEA